MVWLISALMAVSMIACSNAQKKDTKDQAQITTAAKENATQTEAAKTTSKKEKKNEKKKDKKKSQCTVSMVSFQTIWQGNVSFMMGIKWNGCIPVLEEICR